MLWTSCLAPILLTSYLCLSLPQLGSSQGISTSSSSAPSRLWDLLLGRSRRSSHYWLPSSYGATVERFQGRLSRSQRRATLESCQPWLTIRAVGSRKDKGPLWSRMLTSMYFLVPEYGIPLGKVVVGAERRKRDYLCEGGDLTNQMREQIFDCSDEVVSTDGCERGFGYSYVYKLKVNRARALWKYSYFTDPKKVDLGKCVFREFWMNGTVWGSHNEIYPLLDVPEGKKENTAEWWSNVIIRPDGRCVFRANKFERYRLEAAEVEEPHIEYSAPFEVVDQLTPHGPSVGRIKQNQPDAEMCLEDGRCDYPLGRNPCTGHSQIEVKQNLVLTRNDGVKHRLSVEVHNQNGACDPIVAADTALEEVAKVHGPQSTKILYNLALHASTVTVRAGDSWYEYNVTKNVIRPSTSRSQITLRYPSTGMTGCITGLAISRVASRGYTI
nr:VP1a protein [Yanggou tick virus]